MLTSCLTKTTDPTSRSSWLFVHHYPMKWVGPSDNRLETELWVGTCHPDKTDSLYNCWRQHEPLLTQHRANSRHRAQCWDRNVIIARPLSIFSRECICATTPLTKERWEIKLFNRGFKSLAIFFPGLIRIDTCCLVSCVFSRSRDKIYTETHRPTHTVNVR